MDKAIRARIEEAKRELAEVLGSLKGSPPMDQPSSDCSVVIFNGPVHIDHLVLCSALPERREEDLPCET